MLGIIGTCMMQHRQVRLNVVHCQGTFDIVPNRDGECRQASKVCRCGISHHFPNQGNIAFPMNIS